MCKAHTSYCFNSSLSLEWPFCNAVLATWCSTGARRRKLFIIFLLFFFYKVATSCMWLQVIKYIFFNLVKADMLDEKKRKKNPPKAGAGSNCLPEVLLTQRQQQQ